MPFAETLTDFINADTPGYVSATINYMPVDAVFDEHYAVAFDISEGTRPVLQCIAAAVYGDMKGAPAEVNGVEYTVVEVQPDGTGMVVLLLEKV